MNYAAAIDYLLSFADFERSGRFQARPDVAPMLALLRALGDPHVGRVTVHVAGSKGKGSVCAMVESVLRAAGLTTGLYTSPHLYDYTERVRIDGQPIAQADFARIVAQMQPAVDEANAACDGRLVTFDLLTALGFVAFRETGVQAQVIEVGLGGRVDQTNVFKTKDIAIITPLSHEHMAILGDRIAQIAAEKAAIITPGCTAVLAPQAFAEAAAVVRDFAAGAGAQVVDVAAEYAWSVAGHDRCGQYVRIAGPGFVVEGRLALLGAHQVENAAAAVAACVSLRERGLDIPDNAIVRGLEAVRWPGRLEVLRERPLVVADGAHNGESARRLAEALRDYFSAGRVTFVVGASGDKDLSAFVEALAPMADRVFAARSKHPRAMDPARIRDAFTAVGVPAEDVDSVAGAMERAMAATEAGGVICLTGSLFVAAEGRLALAAGGN